MLRRKIDDELARWKADSHHKSLIVQGARQVGKTYAIEHFGEAHYERVVTLNFEEHPEYKAIFSGGHDAASIFAQLSLFFPGVDFTERRVLLFLDEIQSCPNAITSLKFLTLDGRADVIASGSLLGIAYREVSSFPVGYVDHMSMHSLDFKEFLWGMGLGDDVVAYLKGFFDRREQVPDAVQERMMRLFRQYVVVGGMPEAVQRFVDTDDFSKVLQVQRDILAEYGNDIAKYAVGSEKAKARACFLSIPKQLARDSKKFSYAVVEPKSSARKYGGSLQWLYDAGIINFCYKLTAPELPFEGNADNTKFKVYMRDTGLLVAMLEEGSQKDILNGNLGIYKGAVYENIVGDMFAKNGKPLYYYERNNSLEMDFFIRYEGQATAVEVKASQNRKAKSMQSLIEKHGVVHGIKLAPGNFGTVGDKVEVMPIYMAMFL